MKEVVIADDGMLPVTLRGVRLEIDLYETLNRLSDAHAKAANDPGCDTDAGRQREFYTKVADLVESLGFPRVSHREAVAFDAAVTAAVDEVGKAQAAPQTPA